MAPAMGINLWEMSVQKPQKKNESDTWVYNVMFDPWFNTNLHDQNNNKDERILKLNVRLFLVLFLPYGIVWYCFFSYLYHNQDSCLWFFFFSSLSINRCLSLYVWLFDILHLSNNPWSTGDLQYVYNGHRPLLNLEHRHTHMEIIMIIITRIRSKKNTKWKL